MAKAGINVLSHKVPVYKIFAFDIETTGTNNEFLMGSIVGENYKEIFWNKEEMADCLVNESRFSANHKMARIFACNLYFDAMQLFYKTKHFNKIEPIFRGSRMLQARMKTKTQQIILLDSLNYVPFSVKQQGKIINLPKLDTPKYILENRMPFAEEHDEIEAYNIRDSEITYNFMQFMQKSFNELGCKMRMTAASTALDLFKRKYLKEKIFQESRWNIELEYKAYYGGRVEVFKRGMVKDCNYYDFNSLYPSVMLNEFPNPSSVYFKEKGTKGIIDAYEGISEVDIYCPDRIDIPLLPFRQDDKLLFPTGLMHGFYSNLEIRKAVELGYDLLDVHKQIYYTKTFKPFEHYILDLYKKRKEAKENKSPIEIAYKLMMNSLYGKMGQKITGKEMAYHLDNVSPEMMSRMERKGKPMLVGDWLYYSPYEVKHIAGHIMPILSLYATAYARLKLYDTIKDINVIYVDTDSIITPNHLRTSNELGDLKLEYEIDEGIFIRPKMYGFRTKDNKSVIRIKGNPISVKWEYDRFKEFLATPQVVSQQFSTFKLSNKKKIPYNTVYQMEKSFELEDNKRKWKGLLDINSLESSSPIKI